MDKGSKYKVSNFWIWLITMSGQSALTLIMSEDNYWVRTLGVKVQWM